MTTTEPPKAITDQERRHADEEHVQRLVDAIVAAEPTVEFGSRKGPCVVEFRDWWSHGWPCRRGFSCLGCQFHERDAEYRTNYCVHPAFLQAYGSQQAVASNDWWRTELAQVNAFSCPVLRLAGVQAHCPAPDQDLLPGKKRSTAFRSEAEIFKIPQRVPYYVVEAYAAGAVVDSQTPSF